MKKLILAFILLAAPAYAQRYDAATGKQLVTVDQGEPDQNKPWPVAIYGQGINSTSWTSATGVDTANTYILSNPTYGTGVHTGFVAISAITTSTFTGGALNFEVSIDGTNWQPIMVSRIDSGAAETTYTLVASTSRGWTVSATGFNRFRVRLNPAITGTGTLTLITTATASSEQPQVIAAQATASNLKGQVGGLDANGAAITANPILVGGIAQANQPVAVSDDQMRRFITSLDGGQYVRIDHPVRWSCAIGSLAATLTQCQAAPAAGLKLYLTDVTVQTTTTTSGTYGIQYGTGSNCATGAVALFPKSATADRWNAPITTSAAANFVFRVPLEAAAANAICIIGTATNTIRIQLHGFTAP
jgi:hypothetical protein